MLSVRSEIENAFKFRCQDIAVRPSLLFMWETFLNIREFHYNDKLASCSTYCRNNILLKHILYYWSRNNINLRINDDVEVKPTRLRDFGRLTFSSKPKLDRNGWTSDCGLVRGLWLNWPFSQFVILPKIFSLFWIVATLISLLFQVL